MIVLFVAHHIDHLVDGIILEAHLRRTDVLRHIDAGAVATQQQLLIQSLVGKVCPDRAVVMTLEESFGKTFLNFGLTLQVGLALVVYLIEGDTEFLIGLVEAGIHPIVHLLPQGAHFRVVLLPLHEHLVGFLDERCLLFGFLLVHALGHELLHLFTIVLVEGHIVVTDEVVTFLTTRLWCLAIAVFQPCQHRFADMDTTVVHDVGLHHLVTIGFHDLCQRPSEEVVTHMSEVQGLIGIGRRVLDHHEGSLPLPLQREGSKAETRVGIDGLQQFQPGTTAHAEVQEALHHVELLHGRAVCLQILTYLLCCLLRTFLGSLHKGEHHKCQVTLKLTSRLLQLQHFL